MCAQPTSLLGTINDQRRNEQSEWRRRELNPRPKNLPKDFYKLTPIESENSWLFFLDISHQPLGINVASRLVYAREVRSRNVSSKTVA